jgi:hypothetical protein
MKLDSNYIYTTDQEDHYVYYGCYQLFIIMCRITLQI